METKTIKLDKELLSSKTIYEGKTNLIEIKKYWDSHGKKVDWGKDTKTYDHPAEIKIISKQVKYNFEYIAPQVFEVWDLFVDGKKLDLEAELTGYRECKTKLVLNACVGAG